MKTPRVVWMLTTAVLAAILVLPTTQRALAQNQPPAAQQDQTTDQPDQAPAPQDQQDQTVAQPDQTPDQPEASPAQDPPGRVARLSYSNGSVSFQPGGEGDWVDAVLNRPLTNGDNLWADKDARAEFQIGSSSVRMNSETSVTFLDLDDRTTQLRLSQGSLMFRVRHLDDEDRIEIDTPNSAFQVQRAGVYRVDVNADGTETDVTVWKGRGEVTGGGDSYIVVAGQRASFTGSDNLDHQIGQIPRDDDFDSFALDRDRREDRADSSNYISPDVTGADDLDEYGHWHYAADYGPVWTPSAVAPGWAPYRFGHWVWIAPWGWTWVEDEPWGFAPFHYGRWAFVEGGWCWAPGPVVVRPVYAPAFVAFVGGGGFGIGVGPAVAWFPLAPREVFVPWYRTSRVYVNNVNITNTRVNITQVTNVYNTTIIRNNTNVNRITYANQRVTNGVTAVGRDTFVNARPVSRGLIRVDPRQLAEAPVVHNIPAQPVRNSVMGAGRPAMVRPPAAVFNRPVVGTRMPPQRPAFQQRQPAMNVRPETPGRPEPPVRTENQPARPPANPRLEGQGTAPRPQPPTMNNRPEAPNPPRPGAAPRAPEARPAETARPAEIPRPVPRPSAEGRPLVRSAPPVQDRPERDRSEEQKFRTWQQQRPEPPAARPSAPAPRAAPRAEPPHAEKPKQH